MVRCHAGWRRDHGKKETLARMIIDRKTGDLVVGTERLGPSLAEQEFLGSRAGQVAIRVRQTAMRNSYEVWLPEVLGRDLGVVFGFPPGGRLQQVRLKFVKPEIRAAGSSGWSKAVEDEMKHFHDRWLSHQLGTPPHDFPWGRVTSVIDQHGYSAVIIVKYDSDTRKLVATVNHVFG